MKAIVRQWILPLIAGALLSACATDRSFDYVPGSEIPPGPGLISGSDGEFTVFRK